MDDAQGSVVVGTSGYSFADWVGNFYPTGTRKGDMLKEYSRHFTVVEVNSTYYRIPHPIVLRRMEEKTPEGINLHRLGPKSSFDNFLVMSATLPRFYLKALRFARKQRFDIVHCHDLDTLPLGYMISKMSGAKVIYDSHESYTDMIADSAPAVTVRKIARMFRAGPE